MSSGGGREAGRGGGSRSPSGTEDFQGTARYEAVRRLGAGSFGVVYEAWDRERRRRVALKMLRYADPENLLRLKREFRALADVTHRNLAQLYELESDGDCWYLTMELVDGVDVLEYVGRQAATAPGRAADAPEADRGREVTRSVTYDRLRSVVAQLMEGVSALHAAGKLHRDIKPGNVLVTAEGRVVLLDFGLVGDLRPSRSAADSSLVPGTPAYMAPEQAAELTLSEASDLYAIGVLVHEALTGRRPFEGGVLDVMAGKQHGDPPPPSRLVPGVPADLDEVCADLLRRDPKRRPAAGEVIRRLGRRPEETEAHVPSQKRQLAPFVGRDDALAELSAALGETRRGRTIVLEVAGASGVGKTALVQHLLDGVEVRDPRAMVLRGRCHEREAVPFKALDSLVDALAAFLGRLRQAEVERVLPRDILALARLFPVLRQVEAVAAARRRVLEIPDTQELRRRASGALRELLSRIGEERLAVLFVDDLQWADGDSLALLGDLLRPPDPPPLLLLLARRDEGSEEEEDVARGGEGTEARAAIRRVAPGEVLEAAPPASFDAALSGLAVAASSGVRFQKVLLGPLSAVEARSLAQQLLLRGEPSASGPHDEARAATVARESGGNPFFIGELVRYLRGAEGGAGLPADATLDDVMKARIGALPGEARRVLDVVAVAGRPVPLSVVRRVAELPGDEHPAFALLRAEHLVRTRRTKSPDELESWHDRIRDIVLAALPGEAQRRLHARLAFHLEVTGVADPEALAFHLERAGDPERAADFAERAAAGAEELLAFDRAARLFRKTLELVSDPVRTRSLRIRLGDALTKAGRGAEAAREFRRAAAMPDAAGSTGVAGLELSRRAAEQLFRSGHLDEGLEVIRDVLGAVGLRLAKTPRQAFLSFLLRRLLVSLRGLSFRERDPSQIAPARLTRIDICWSVAIGLGIVDTIRGQDFQARHLLLALSAGEPYRVARALAVEVAFSGTGGGRTRPRTRRLSDRTRLLVERVDHPHARALLRLTTGMAAFLEGRWVEAAELCSDAEQILKERCTGVAWELDNAQIYGLLALTFTGEWREVARRLPALIREALERGDLWAVTNLRIRISHLVFLAADEPDRSREEVQRAMAEWSRQGYHIQHYWALYGLAETALYAGAGAEAWELVEDDWPRLARSLILRIQRTRLEAWHLRSRAALAAVAGSMETASGGAAERHLTAARADARRLLRDGMPWGCALAELVLAGAASLSGRGEEALVRLRDAVRALEAAGMGLHAAAARRRIGRLKGGEEGQRLVDEADAWMAAQRIRNPARLTGMLVPGFRD